MLVFISSWLVMLAAYISTIFYGAKFTINKENEKYSFSTTKLLASPCTIQKILVAHPRAGAPNLNCNSLSFRTAYRVVTQQK